MLPKEKRIPRKLFPNLNLKGKTLISSHFLAKTGPGGAVRIGVSVSKKVAKKAVLRNRTRRRVYSALGGILSHLKPSFYLIIARPGAEKLRGEELSQELSKLLSK